MYQWKDRARFSEIGEDGRMTLTALMNVFQDCANFQSDSLGVGADYLAAKKRAWLMNFWQVFVERYPREREQYTVETRAWKFDRFYGHRNFALFDEAGERMACANSIWFFVDTERMRPVRPTQEDLEPYGVDPCIEMEYADSRKIPLPKQMRREEPFPVRRANLDINHHVNNVQYIRMAAEYFPADLDVYEMRVEYNLAATLGDILVPMTGERGDGWFVVALCREDGRTCAVVEVRGRA
ncbi:MAG: thioesterase [Lachnospiraceae bacterium]|nr:thioesterase [Lachnospiraceae bacterium]